ncbi:nucleotide pyrophosphohydrolase [Qipengyuania sp. CAU 1752]
MDNTTTTKELYDRLVEFRDRRDWKKFHSPKNLAMSVSIESAELLELFQWKSETDIEAGRTSEEFLAEASGEIADVLIYLVLLAGDLGIDPVEAALAKTASNEQRFPADGPGQERKTR